MQFLQKLLPTLLPPPGPKVAIISQHIYQDEKKNIILHHLYFV
jgi:hypothetical protein